MRRTALSSFACFASVVCLGIEGYASDRSALPVPVVIALETLNTLDPDSTDHSARWLGALVEALEAPAASGGGRRPVRVLEAFDVASSVLAHVDGEEPSAELRIAARRAGARYLVLASLTRLAGRASLDVKLLPVLTGGPLAHFSSQGLGDAGARHAIDEAAERLRTVLADRAASRSQRTPVWANPLEDEVAAFSATAGEAVSRVPGPAVVEIRIEGNRRIEADAIRVELGTAIGEALRPERIAEDVRRIYELGFFRDVRVLTTDLQGGKLVTFVVDENPIIRRVTITGNDNIGGDDVKERLTLSVGSTIDFPLLLENRARIEQLYQSRGYYLASAEYQIEPLGEDAVGVNFEVIEGNKLRLQAIEFDGNDQLDDDELRRGLQTKPWRWYSLISHFWDHSGLYAEPLFFQDLDTVNRTYMDNGFIRVRLSEPEVEYDDEGLTVRVQVDEGQQYRVGSVDVLGDETMDRSELLELIELTPGDVFSRSVLTADVERLRSRYSDRGFFSAEVRPRTDVRADELTVDVLFEADKGELYFVDWIQVHGNTRTRDSVLRREMSLAEGDLYSSSALQRSRARVQRLGFFEEVNLQTREIEESSPNPIAGRRVGVDIDVVERATGSFSFGAGVGSTDGFLLNASIRQDNLFGKGYALNASVDLGSNNSRGLLRFVDPFFMGTPAAFASTASLSTVEFIDFDQEILGFDINVDYPLDEGETRTGVGYAFTSREISGFSGFQASSLLQREEFEGKTTTSLVTLNARRDTRDDIRFPKRGQVSGAAVEFAGLGGLNQFVRLEGRTTWFIPTKRLFGLDSTFVINSRIGWVLPFNAIGDFDLPGCTLPCGLAANWDPALIQPLTQIDTDLELPLSERYFLGGLGSFQVRGFKQRSLGPRRAILDQRQFPPGGVLFVPTNRNFDTLTNEQAGGSRCIDGTNDCNDLSDTDIDDFEDLDLTDVIGGNKMFLLNFELQFPISEDLGLTGIVFFDMGNAFAEDEGINLADLRLGAGVGGLWFSPFGPILVEIGVPLDALEDEDGSVFEFSLGGSQF